MSKKKSYIDHQELAKQLKVGDSVLLPIFTRGNQYAPSVGRITAVLEGLGFVDVQTNFGNIRLLPSQVVKDNSLDTSHMRDTSEQTYDRTKAKERSEARAKASKIASYYFKEKFGRLTKKATDLRDSGFNEMEAYDFIFRRHASSFSDDEIKRAVKIAYVPLSRAKEALYWKAKGRRYVPTVSEVDEGCFYCPKCQCQMKKTHYKKNTQLYACPECLWLIRPKDLLERGVEPESLEDDSDSVDFFSPNDPLLRNMYGDKLKE